MTKPLFCQISLCFLENREPAVRLLVHLQVDFLGTSVHLFRGFAQDLELTIRPVQSNAQHHDKKRYTHTVQILEWRVAWAGAASSK